ncbi:MAG: glycosyltransferase [Desulfobacteraceae bacterium]|nr:MAG: glycosyltransferase [Desulfobacteraceae bacterium]
MKKRVLMIAYTGYTGDARIKREAGTLVQDGRFETKLLCLREGEQKRSYVADGVRVEELNMPKYSGNSAIQYLFSYIHFLVRSFFACSWHFLCGKVDIVHVHNMPNCLVFAALLPRIFGKKVILDVHDCMPELFSIKFKKLTGLFFKILCWEESVSCSFADKVICVNHVQRDLMVKRGVDERKLFVSMNVPDHRIFRRRDPYSRGVAPPESLKMVYHGTIAKRLGVDLAIQAVAELREKTPGLEFHFWGGGEYLQECRNLSCRLGVENRIHFNGIVKVEELTTVLSPMELGIAPNRRSSATEVMLPVKMLEYVMMGIPVLAPRLKAIQYYFSEDKVGYFDPDDLESLKDAILKVYADEQRGRKMARKAQLFLDRYGWEKQSADFIDFYLSV